MSDLSKVYSGAVLAACAVGTGLICIALLLHELCNLGGWQIVGLYLGAVAVMAMAGCIRLATWCCRHLAFRRLMRRLGRLPQVGGAS